MCETLTPPLVACVWAWWDLKTAEGLWVEVKAWGIKDALGGGPSQYRRVHLPSHLLALDPHSAQICGPEPGWGGSLRTDLLLASWWAFPHSYSRARPCGLSLCRSQR